METKLLFYDNKSIDCCLSALVNKGIFGFEMLGISNTTNSENINYYQPPTNLLNKDFYFFIGLKPSISWCNDMKILNPNVKIYIFTSDIHLNIYNNLSENVFPITITHKTLTKEFYDYVILLLNLNELNPNDIIWKTLLIKIDNIVLNFEMYCNNFTNDIVNPLYSDIFYFVSLLKFCDSETLNYIITIIENSFVGTKTSGLSKNKMMENLTNTLISKSIISEFDVIKTVKINLFNESINSFDKEITKYFKNVNNLMNINFVEYWELDNNKNVLVKIKPIDLYVLPYEINDYQNLVDYIGLINKDSILNYITNKYDTICEINSNGLISFTTTIQNFFD